MNKISKITKRDIFDLFNNGIKQVHYFENSIYNCNYHGRLEEIEFLERLYHLESMESSDHRYLNAKGDIWQHTVNNNDYPVNWVFKDERFELFDGDDTVFLDFICEIFHPEVRDESTNWRLFFDRINELLKYDEFELYSYQKISGREVFTWRVYSEKHLYLIPYSIRQEQRIKSKDIKLKLSKELRYQILKLLEEYDELRYFTDETNWNYTKQLSELAMEELEKFYIPKNYENNHYVPAKDFDCFIYNTSPFSVLDVIEAFAYLLEENSHFKERVNDLLSHHKVSFNLTDGGEIINTNDELFQLNRKKPVREPGLEKLLLIAEEEYTKGNYSTAVEKLWDAFERLKTYYSPSLDKKSSAEKIVKEVAKEQEEFQRLFNDEFKSLTTIGNNFKIRHHETTKIDISEEIHYQYFYKRCMALISTVIKILY
ncbi:hypothetical protein [Macrococcus carouselicus]|uniref:AbiJ-NTD3 domain-containing protein n=1 Tax=Macrococcus carouselicus TaxID=69969 RepID=A0A9Q8CGW4_9STAP|nr:hypothetical protein [Macrococcus carouselicus]TDL95534.1 hypothetical protein ERX40_10145 [Macrococcus carouselicus]